MPPPYGHFGIARSVLRLSVPWRSCLGYRHTGCLRLSHRRPPEMCGLRTRPRTDVDPPRFLLPSVAPPGFCNRGEVRYGSVGGLEYKVRQSRSYCLCINVALCSTAMQCICRSMRRSSMTMNAPTYYGARNLRSVRMPFALPSPLLPSFSLPSPPFSLLLLADL